jgi:GTPase
LKKVKKANLRKGMVLVDQSVKPKACREFEAEVLVLYHSTTICPNYQAVVHCGVAQQTAKVQYNIIMNRYNMTLFFI